MCTSSTQKGGPCVLFSVNFGGHPLDVLKPLLSEDHPIITKFYNDIESIFKKYGDSNLPNTLIGRTTQQKEEFPDIFNALFDVFCIRKNIMNTQNMDATTGLELLIGEYFCYKDNFDVYSFTMSALKKTTNLLDELGIGIDDVLMSNGPPVAQSCVKNIPKLQKIIPKLYNIYNRVKNIPDWCLKWCGVMYIAQAFGPRQNQNFCDGLNTYRGIDIMRHKITNLLKNFTGFTRNNETEYIFGADEILNIDDEILNIDNILPEKSVDYVLNQLFIHIIDRSMGIFDKIYECDDIKNANFCAYITNP